MPTVTPEQVAAGWNIIATLIGSGILAGVAVLAWYARGFKASITAVNHEMLKNYGAVNDQIDGLRDIAKDMVRLTNDHVTDIAVLKERWHGFERRLKALERGITDT